MTDRHSNNIYLTDVGLWCDAVNGWEAINGKCYKVTTKSLDWDQAR